MLRGVTQGDGQRRKLIIMEVKEAIELTSAPGSDGSTRSLSAKMGVSSWSATSQTSPGYVLLPEPTVFG
jgi:hypothetical protein